MFRSATFKLTVWYLAIAMAISLLFSIALYNVTTSELSRGFHNESQNIYTQFPMFQNDPRYDLKSSPLYDNSVHRIFLRLVGFNIIVFIGTGYSSYLLARKTLEPIEAAHEQQKRFTADVSHELRTPLTAIKMESEVALLNTKATASELKETINSSLEEVGKLEDLINNLLRLTRLEADELQHNFKNLSSEEIIKSAIEKVNALAKQKDINISFNVTEAKIMGDQESLIQLVVILLDNAIKYSPKNSTISVDNIKGKDYVFWRIKDEGSGIEPKALDHVFDRFYRADSSRTKLESDGYGLGLSIAKMIADIHKSTITLTSRVNHGTTASIKLPLPKI